MPKTTVPWHDGGQLTGLNGLRENSDINGEESVFLFSNAKF